MALTNLCANTVFICVLTSFLQTAIIRLRNTPTNFCEVTLSPYGAMFELGENGVVLIKLGEQNNIGQS